MQSTFDEYDMFCARCWGEAPKRTWFQEQFPVLDDLNEKRLLCRYLCPICAANFPSDDARRAFLKSTLPAKYIQLPTT